MDANNVVNIDEIKKHRLETLPKTEEEYFKKIATEENRKEVNELVVNFIQENQLGLEEVAMGFSDVFTSIILSMILNSTEKEEEVEASNQRFSTIHKEIASLLNTHTDAKIAETLLVLNSLFLEGITSIVKEAGE